MHKCYPSAKRHFREKPAYTTITGIYSRKLYPDSTKCYMIQELRPSDCNEFQLGHQLTK
jgi:hypothetical protein